MEIVGFTRSDLDTNWREKKVENKNGGSFSENWRKSGERSQWQIRKPEANSLMKKIHGCWKILCDDSEYERIWKCVMKLYEESSGIFPVPPQRFRINVRLIELYTAPFSNRDQIKKVADDIRQHILFPFHMLYVEAPFMPRKPQEYMHLPGNEFYEADGDNLWKSVNKNAAVVPNAAITTLHSDGIILPSKVTDVDYIYFPATEESNSDMSKSEGGKWIIHSGHNVARHDELWSSLIPLCNEGCIVGLKSSTALINEAQQHMGGEAILCYTADAEDLAAVKKAADLIRKCINHEYMLFYKTNASSEAGHYRREGCSSVSSYMHSVLGNFYKRDRCNRWTLVGL